MLRGPWLDCYLPNGTMCGVVLAGAGLGLRAVADGDGVTARHERGSFVDCGEWHRISPTHNATIKCAFTYYVLTSSIDESDVGDGRWPLYEVTIAPLASEVERR